MNLCVVHMNLVSTHKAKNLHCLDVILWILLNPAQRGRIFTYKHTKFRLIKELRIKKH